MSIGVDWRTEGTSVSLNARLRCRQGPTIPLGGNLARSRLFLASSVAAVGFAALLVSLPVIGSDRVLTAPRTPRAPTSTEARSTGAAPAVPTAKICGNVRELTGPATPPSGAVSVPSGNNSSLTLDRANTTYWFAPGNHTLGNSKFNQIIPSDGDTYIGGPGAVISGQGVNDFAFAQHATDVTIEYLTIENFGSNGGNNNQGVVNHDSATGWTIEHNTIRDDAGAGVMLGTGDVLKKNCLTRNGQYGFSAYSPSGPENLTVTENEISYNDTYNWEKKSPGCGCSGGGKFWDTNGAVVTDNYVHDNENVGLWADTDNSGFDISHNYISNNYSEGVMYEISYNGLIAHNTFIHNGVGRGPTNPSFPTGAVYISESGSDKRVGGPYGSTFSITGNVFIDNWAGVVMWENANRFCGPDSPDNAGSSCTLVAPTVAKVSTCRRPGIDVAPLFNDCRWRTMNVSVTDNKFMFTRSGVGNGCASSNGCGFNALFSIYGTSPPYKGWIVPTNISDNQNNRFSGNTYSGPWLFMAANQGVVVTQSQWTKGFTDKRDGSNIHFIGQDTHSSFAP